METLYNKEKKLETVLEKLKNLSNSPNADTGELEQLYIEKNQLQSEKLEIEQKFNDLILKYNELKKHVEKMEKEQKKTREMQDRFSQDIEELGE